MASPRTLPRRPAKRTVTTAVSPNQTSRGSQQFRDPAIDRALQLSTFESSYSTEDFIGTLSESLISDSKSNPGAFDPKPFLSTFSPALDSLLSLRQQVAERTKKMESEVRRAEREYGKRLRELDGGFEAIGSSFSSLESKITDVGLTAVRIGEQLESLHQTRSTAQSTSLLLSYYLSLVHQTSTTPDANNPAANPLETLFATRTSREGRARLSIILRRLMAVAKDMADNAASALGEAETTATPTAEVGDKSSAKALGKRRMEKEKAERVRDEVERYCERFEKEVLRLFDRSYRKGDPRMMAHCAKTLQDFNGGASCVQIYVNQHDFFISKDRVLEEAEKQVSGDGQDGTDNKDIWATIGDPDASPPTSEPGMAALFKEIRVTVSQEAQIVKAVFPNPSAVMQVFLQRVFAQVIQQHLESLVSRATAISTLAVLRSLNMVHSMSSALLEDLKTYDGILNAPTAGPIRGGVTGTGPLTTMLDQAMEEMFVPWLEGTRYLEIESKNLVELYAGLLSRFTRYHEMVLKAKPNSLLDKVVHQLSSSGSAASSSSTAQAAAAAISKYANVFTSSASQANLNAKSVLSPTNGTSTKPALPPHLAPPGGTSSPSTRSGAMTPVGNRPGLSRAESMRGELVNRGLEDKVWATDGVLNMEMAERMLKWHAEAVGRVVELSSSGDVGKNALALSKVLAEAIGRSFIETALDSALARLDSQDVKIETDISPLSTLKPADLICHLWQRYTAIALLPLSGSSTSIRREMVASNQHNVMRMEGKVSMVVQKAIDNIINWLSVLLNKQKKNDYKPKNDELSFARTNTEPCQLICDFLETVRDGTKEGLSGKNEEALLTEIGVAFHSLLLDHYKKFPVNPTGGLMLTKDLASYQELMSTFGVLAINDRYDMLRQLGNCFIVQPNVLKSYLTESHLGRIDSRLLRAYLAQRSDWGQFSRTLVLDDGLAGESADVVTTTTGPSFDRSSLSLTSGLSRLGGVSSAGGIGVGGGSGKWKGRGGAARLSGVAGVGMGKLKEMLKEFDSLSPEEAERAAKRDKEMMERIKANPNYHKMAQGLPPNQHLPVYFGLH